MAQMRVDDTRIGAVLGLHLPEGIEVGASVSSQAAATSNASWPSSSSGHRPGEGQIEVPSAASRASASATRSAHRRRLPDRRFGAVRRVVHGDPAPARWAWRWTSPTASASSSPPLRPRPARPGRPARLLVPLEALVGGESRPGVLLIRDGKVATAPVQLGPTDGPLVQVTRGLAPDDQVIVQGKELVREGQAVKAVPAKTGS
jgi:hypothetical protein